MNLVDILRRHPFKAPVPRHTDPEWKRLPSTDSLDSFLEYGRSALSDTLPVIPASAWIAFSREGDRQAFEIPYKRRRIRLAALTVLAARGELSSGQTETIDDYLWAICEESSWVYSAHLKNRHFTELPALDPGTDIDLGSAMTGLLLAETLYILGKVVHDEIAERVRQELDRRLLVPYRFDSGFHWMHITSNWNSVCHCGVLATAIYRGTEEHVLADMITKAQTHLKRYLDGFDREGGSAEGLGYWSYGFGHFVLLNDFIERRTGGEYSLFEQDRDLISNIAELPNRLMLSPGHYVNFSDSVERAKPELFLLRIIRERFGVQVAVHDELNEGQFDTIYRNLFSLPADTSKPEILQPSITVFPELQWVIARMRLENGTVCALATKGGHNGEEHNHNDLGTFILHCSGESYIAELGKDVYRRNHFNEHRYEFLSCSSEGHSVPRLNGCLQQPGRDFRARIVDGPYGWFHGDEDASHIVTYDLTDAYPASAGVRSLVRTFRFPVDSGTVMQLTDEVQWEHHGLYESSFWTFLIPEYRAEENCVSIPGNGRALVVRSENQIGGPAIEYYPEAVLGRGEQRTGAYRIFFRHHAAGSDCYVFSFELDRSKRIP